MSKRFIDTGLFDDDWFMNLPKDAKLLWVYFITKCDHAGIIHLNIKLCQVQTGIKDLTTVRQQLGNRIITVSEQLYFIPKFVEYQYPGFPNCNFQMAKSAIKILEKYELIINSQLTVNIQSPDCIGNGNGIIKSNGNGKSKEAEFDFSFLDESWKELFLEWIEYKKSIKDNYTTQKSIEACYRNLKTLSSGDLITAKKIVDQSIGNKYKGLFPLKEPAKQKDDFKISTKYL